MNKRAEQKLLGLGLDSNLVKKLKELDLPSSSLKNVSKARLAKLGLNDSEVEIIYKKVNRTPISPITLENIISKSSGTCAYCADGNRTRPYQIHHIKEYHLTQNNDEENLLLVCPNHHVTIHQQQIGYNEQLSKKEEWENISRIATEYSQSGITFPFGAFEYLDYNIAGSITEIFTFGAPKNSICTSLANCTFAQNALSTLQQENAIILSGKSGSGKSTMAIGIAGKLNEYKVYRYTIGDKSSIDIARDIITFLQLANIPVTLIIDDANFKMGNQQIEQVFKSANRKKKIIIVHTRDTNESPSQQQYFTKNVFHLTWESIRESVIKNILQYEYEVVTYLQEKKVNKFNNQEIGFSLTCTSLRNVLGVYSKETESVWQFIYMVTSGQDLLERDFDFLYSSNRLDLLVLLIGIQQISRIEDGTTINELSAFYNWHPIYATSTPPSKDWIEKKIEELISLRRVKYKLDRVNSVHRMYAINFLKISYAKNKTDTEAVLNHIFLDDQKTKEKLILWTWLRALPTKEYLQKWLSTMDISSWKELGNKAALDGVGNFATLCWSLHLAMINDRNPILEAAISEILTSKTEIISQYINNPIKNNFYYLGSLSTVIRQYLPTLWPDIVKTIEPNLFALQIKNVEPWEVPEIEHLFYSIAEVTPLWIITLSERFSFSDFVQTCNRITRGDVDLFFEITHFYRRYIFDFRRCNLDFCADLLSNLLSNCNIKDIRCKGMFRFIEIAAFPKLINNIFKQVNVSSWASEYVQLAPLHWENLLFLSSLSLHSEEVVEIYNFLDLIDIEHLAFNTSKYYLDHETEFRFLVYQLTYARPAKKAEFAMMIYSLMIPILSSDKYCELNVLLHACKDLDEDMTARLCKEFNLVLQPINPPFEENDISEIIDELVALAATNEDFPLLSYKIKEI